MRGMGRLFKRGPIWWIAFSHRGQEFRESAKSERESDARRLLKKRIGEIQGNQFIGPSQERVLFSDLLDGLILDYQNNGRKSLGIMGYRLKSIRAAFALDRAADVTEARIERYKRERLEAGKAPATVNRELAAIKRAFKLAVRQKRIPSAPNIEMLAEHNARQGFFEVEEFKAVLKNLPAYLQAPMEFAYLTGWRKGEFISLRWAQVDFAAGMARLEPGTTKNDEGREFPFSALPELAALLRRQREMTTERERETSQVIPWVFHRDGEPIKRFEGSWKKACKAAGAPGRLVHDFRRTAVRNLERAGVPRSVAMKLTGHKTEAVYRRYAIVAEADLREGVAKLAALHKSGSERRRSVIPIQEAAGGGA